METRIDGNGGCFELDRRSKMSSKLAIKTSKSRPGDRPKSSGDIRISTIYMIVSYERENGRIARRTEIKVKSGLVVAYHHQPRLENLHSLATMTLHQTHYSHLK